MLPKVAPVLPTTALSVTLCVPFCALAVATLWSRHAGSGLLPPAACLPTPGWTASSAGDQAEEGMKAFSQVTKLVLFFSCWIGRLISSLF